MAPGARRTLSAMRSAQKARKNAGGDEHGNDGYQNQSGPQQHEQDHCGENGNDQRHQDGAERSQPCDIDAVDAVQADIGVRALRRSSVNAIRRDDLRLEAGFLAWRR